jgi:succinyl-diaminopimelate desuccinylase
MSQINYKEVVLKRKEEILKDLVEALKLNTELIKFDPAAEHPFGKNITESLLLMEKFCKRDGLDFVNHENWVGEISLGKQKEHIVSVGHLDVVPATGDWVVDPYAGAIVDGKIISRGVVDDKGPTIAVYWGVKILKELGVPLSKRIKLLISLDEESGMRDVEYYQAKIKEVPVAGFIPDAQFPLIFAEKGMTPTKISFSEKLPYIKSINGGIRINMVPDTVTAIFEKDSPVFGQIVTNLKEFSAHTEHLAVESDPAKATIIVKGLSAHGSMPECGVNAVYYLFKALSTIKEYESSELVKFVSGVLFNDYFGQKLGVYHKDEHTGTLSENLGIFTYDGQDATLILDIRFPKGITADHIAETVKNTAAKYGGTSETSHRHDVLFYDPESDLVKTLHGIYVKHTGDTVSKPFCIGGGTFAKMFSNSPAFGPTRPGIDPQIHQPNEYSSVDDFLLSVIIYLEALYELAK